MKPISQTQAEVLQHASNFGILFNGSKAIQVVAARNGLGVKIAQDITRL
jgi:hypothetical protein